MQLIESIKVNRIIKNNLIKGKALLSSFIVALAFIVSPIIGLATVIYEGIGLHKTTKINYIKDLNLKSIIEEAAWVIIALIVGAFLPLYLGISLVLWRSAILLQAVRKKE